MPTPLHPETPDLYGAFPRLSEQQLLALFEHGERRPTGAGDVLVREGAESCEFFVILEGTVASVEGRGLDEHQENVLSVHGPRRFLGELSMLTGEGAFVSAVVMEPGEVLAVPLAFLRDLVVHDRAIGDLVLRAYLLRRSMLIEIGLGLRVVGSRYSADTRRLREFATRNRVPHAWIDLEEDEQVEELLSGLGVEPEETPIVICQGGEVLRNPSNAELARAVRLPAPTVGQSLGDLVILGAGPAGLAAALYGASEGLSTQVFDGTATGGQAGTSSRIENYLGFPAGISGAELAERAMIQAEKFGARFSVPSQACAVASVNGHFVVTFDDGSSVLGRTVLIATGAQYRRLELPGIEELEQTSVYYAATDVEAGACDRKPVAIVGGGNSAGQATLFLADRAERVQLVVREDDLGTHMSRYLASRIQRHPQVDVLLGTEVRELVGDRSLDAVITMENRTGLVHRLEARALFVFIGAEPRTLWLRDRLALDDNGYIITGEDALARRGFGAAGVAVRTRLPLETSCPGIFAAGDVRSGSVKRVASAVGEGSMAVQMVHQYLAR